MVKNLKTVYDTNLVVCLLVMCLTTYPEEKNDEISLSPHPDLRLYAEYCDDEEQHAVLKEQEVNFAKGI